MYSNKLQHNIFYPFVIFIYLSSIFCDVSRVNIFFHIALAMFIISFLITKEMRTSMINDKEYRSSLCAAAAFLIYFSLTNYWSEASHLSSTITHAFYIFIFLCLYRHCEIENKKKYIIGAAYFGIITLTILTLIYVDKATIIQNRLSAAFPFAPDNVIDLGGYMALGILFSAILVRETRNFWFYVPVPLLLICLLLTQSRGPILSLLLAIIITFFCKPKWNHKIIFGLFITLILISLFLYFYGFLDLFFSRIEESTRAGSVRFGIWQHVYEVGKEKAIFGWGFDKELSFKNGYGEPVTTTHSLYFATFLKGGMVGLALLFTLILFALRQCLRHLALNHKAEVAVLLFTLGFYMTQGMFIISNPREYWVLFWLPMAIAMSTPAHKKAHA